MLTIIAIVTVTFFAATIGYATHKTISENRRIREARWARLDAAK